MPPRIQHLKESVDAGTVDIHSSARDDDLRSARFFEVEKYPRMTLSRTRIKFEPGGHLTVEGNLSIRNLTREISWALDFRGVVKDTQGNQRTAFQAKTEFNRKDFGLLTDLEKENGEMSVGNDVQAKLAIEAVMSK